MLLWEFFPGKLPPGEFPPIKFYPLVTPTRKIATKFPLGIMPPISLIRNIMSPLSLSYGISMRAKPPFRNSFAIPMPCIHSTFCKFSTS